MHLRLAIAATGVKQVGYIRVLIGSSNNIVYSAETIKELVEKIKEEKNGLLVTRLKEEDSFVSIEASPESTKTVEIKNPQPITFAIPGNEADLKDFWIEYAKLNQKDPSK